MLPKYYVIKKDKSNPLWDKYLKWINKQSFPQRFTWDDFIYYWYDWWSIFNWFNCEDDLYDFKNIPEVITLEEWDNYINNNKPMENKWYMCIVDWWKAPTKIHKTIVEASVEAMRLCSKENKKVRIVSIVTTYKPKIIAMIEEEEI